VLDLLNEQGFGRFARDNHSAIVATFEKRLMCLENQAAFLLL
jgi:hypothetical protein